MAENLALFTVPVPTIFSIPSVTTVVKVLCSAAFLPTSAQISKFCRTVCPSIVTLKTRLPAALKNSSEKAKVTSYVPLATAML